MPFLPDEPCVFPESIFEPAEPLAEEPPGESPERVWWGVYTKARQEKALARQLFGREIPFYLPLVCKEHLLRGRYLRSRVPLFQGYLFLYASLEERVTALSTNRISRIMLVPNQEELVRDLHQVHQLIALGAPMTIERRLSPGRLVRVRTGSLAGLEGIITHRRGSNRLLIAVNYLQQGVSIEVNDFMVDPI